MTVYSGEERTIWDGESQNVTARATGERFTLHYRLTTHFLYFETGGITRTTQEQVPLINVQDVDVSQTLIQKTRRVGNVLVHILRPNGIRETAVFDSVPDPVGVRNLINQTVHQVRMVAHQRQLAEQQNLNVHRFEQQGHSPAAPLAPGVQGTPAVPRPQADAGAEFASAPDAQQIMDLLKQLGELRDAGVVTDEEFESKKQDLLRRL